MDRKRISCCLALAIVGTLSQGWSQGQREEVNRIAAVVNREVITDNELTEAVKLKLGIFSRQHGISREKVEREMDSIKRETLEELINQRLLLSEFRQLGGVIEEEKITAALDNFIFATFKGDRQRFEESLAKEGLTVAQFRRAQEEQLAVRFLNTRFRESNPPLPEKRQAIYEELIQTRYAEPDLREIRLISIPRSSVGRTPAELEALARRVQKEISEGASFEEKAREHSKDQFAEKGGYAGVIDRSTLNETITQAAFGLPVKKVSEVIEDSTMWRIIWVESQQKSPQPTLEQLTPEIDAMLLEQARGAWIQDLRQRANIVIY